MKLCFKAENHALACAVLPLTGIGSTGLILIYGQFLLTNGACMGTIAGVIYMGKEKNSMDGLEYCSAIIASLY